VAARDNEIAELVFKGLRPPQIAERLGVNERTVYRAKKRRGIPPTRKMAPPMSEHEIGYARRMLEDGASFGEVARTLSRDLKTISKRFRGLSQCSARDGYQTRMMMNMLEAL
jgi:hypothetical protein